MNRCSAALLLVLPVVALGCSNRVPTYPASGTVKFDDGEPVRIGFVEFRCEENGLSARAKLDDHGHFTLGTFSESDGAPAGTYKIAIVQIFNTPPRDHAHDSARDAQSHRASARIARPFSDFATSPLRATITAGADNKFDLQVSRPKD